VVGGRVVEHVVPIDLESAHRSRRRRRRRQLEGQKLEQWGLESGFRGRGWC
jgi:hypothetical protein